MLTLLKTSAWPISIMVSTQDSQSCGESSILSWATTLVNLSGGVGLTNILIVLDRVDTGLTQGEMPKGELAFLKSLGQAYKIPHLAPLCIG